MTFKELTTFCDPVSATGTAPGSLGKLCQDSREVRKNDIFIAVKGYTVDGHKFIQQAVSAGASVIISEKPVELKPGIAVIIVKDTRALIGPLAQKLAGNPAEKMKVVGITGTNGKTTVATLIWQLLTEAGKKASLLGTVEKKINQTVVESRLTTSDPIEIAADMKKMVEAGSEFVVMEVSSHALHQQRTKGIPFSVAIFTNLSLDHLDYHGSMEEYAAAKQLLFNRLDESAVAITNVDDDKGGWMIENTKATTSTLSFDCRESSVQASIKQISETGTTIEIDGVEINTPLIGKFNAYNVAEAYLAAVSLGIDVHQAADILSRCKGAAGRLEKVTDESTLDQHPMVSVDYAHTPDALENVSHTLCEVKRPNQKLVIVFGCGGERDTSKRPQMAKIAENYGDEVVVTSDNPRTEDPDAIIEGIKTGFTDMAKVTAITSRQDAITKTVLNAKAGTIILIAGKGHETYQEVDGERHHFDDREIAREALDSRNGHPKNSEVA